MRFDSRPLRLVMTAGTVAVLWLLAASVGEPFPVPHHTNAAPICDSATTPVPKLARRHKSSGGPVVRTRRSRAGLLPHLTTHLHRTVRLRLAEDRDAIQTDAAAGVDPDNRASLSLRSIGVLIGPLDRRPSSRTYSPRSPRGPPVSV